MDNIAVHLFVSSTISKKLTTVMLNNGNLGWNKKKRNDQLNSPCFSYCYFLGQWWICYDQGSMSKWLVRGKESCHREFIRWVFILLYYSEYKNSTPPPSSPSPWLRNHNDNPDIRLRNHFLWCCVHLDGSVVAWHKLRT